MSSAGDWIGRVVMLVLSGLATFAILTSIQATLDRQAPPPALSAGSEPRATTPPGMPARSGVPGTPSAADPADGEIIAASAGGIAAARPERLEPWLRAISYALLAIAGFTAAMLVLLLRIGGALMLIAQR